MTSIQYRPEIDGLRAFAVLPVILFHFGFSWIAGGYIGVDVFFVISGFLITSIVLPELELGTFSLQRFWARRIRRILPSLIIVIASTLAVTYVLVFKGDHRSIGKQALTALLSVANIYFWRSAGDYWGTTAEESPLLNTWSLSVEEQFYLFFPATLWFVYRFRPQWIQAMCLIAVLASLCLFLRGQVIFPAATFYLLPPRIWELATGCELAVLLFRNDAFRSATSSYPSLALAGLCMVLLSYVYVPKPNGGLAIAVVGTALVIAFGRSGFCHTILTQWLFVYLGRLSYALYLWHWPVLVLAGYSGHSSNKFLLFVIALLLSIASNTLIETPARRSPNILPLIGAGYLSTIGLSCLFICSSGAYDTSGFSPTVYSGRYYDVYPHQKETPSEDWERIFSTVVRPDPAASTDAYMNGGLIIGRGESDPKVVVLGDSHGVMWSDAIRAVTEKLDLKTSFYSMDGVSPFITFPLRKHENGKFLTSDERYAYDKARVDFIKLWKPQIVIICARWSTIKHESATDLCDYVSQHAGHVLLMEQPPELTIGNRNALQYLCYLGVRPKDGVKKYLPMGNSEECQNGRSLVRAIANEHRRIETIQTFDLFQKDSEVLVLDGKNAVYLDDDHLTNHGTQLGMQRIADAMKSLVDLDASE